MSGPERSPTGGGEEFGHNPFAALSNEGLPAETSPADSQPRTEAKPQPSHRLKGF